MNLASFYLCLFMNINTPAKMLWNAISWEKKTTINIWSHCTRITLRNYSLFLFFFLSSLFLGNLRQEAQAFIHSRLLRVSTITWKSRKISNVSCFLNYSWQRCRCIFILFFCIQIFFWFNFRYVAKPFYLKILFENPVILPNWSCKRCSGIDEIKNRPVVFASTFLGKNLLTRQTRCTFNRSRANLNGPIRNTFLVFRWNQSETILLQGSPELWSVSPTCAEEPWVEIGPVKNAIVALPVKTLLR